MAKGILTIKSTGASTRLFMSLQIKIMPNSRCLAFRDLIPKGVSPQRKDASLKIFFELFLTV